MNRKKEKEQEKVEIATKQQSKVTKNRSMGTKRRKPGNNNEEVGQPAARVRAEPVEVVDDRAEPGQAKQL